jgi:ABC-type multidrug transport system ATPase subunit
MGTLTVFETVLYSALLRLPRDMAFEDKRMRTLETMHELGILAIKDSRIGESGKRSISGGEKRRVSIACELVTSPSILFLDEPTSGLDAFNAINVIECLSGLAKNYNRTVVFTIHQPRSNIVTLFDQLLLLAGGRAVYSGEYAKCQDYFDSIGHPCPPGYNIADFLIDLTMQDERAPSSATTVSDQCGNGIAADEESATPHMGHSPRAPTFDGDTELRRRTHAKQQNKDRWSLFSSSTPSSPTTSQSLGPHLTQLVEAYEQSDIAQSIKESARSQYENGHGNGGHSLADQQNLEKLAGFKQASLWTQFTILSGRAFKNLYRNPMLMLSHYVVSVAVALLCSFLFARVTCVLTEFGVPDPSKLTRQCVCPLHLQPHRNDIPGFQNRMGLFFFVLALFGFSCLTSLDAFAKERVLFMRERSNGYYSPATYFTSKVLFDVLPLRVIPPFILGAIIYRPVGLVPTVAEFWKFILVLILFNLSASSVVFFISIVISNSGVANLVGSLVMLFNLLFAGLLVNRDKVPLGIGWLQTISFFHAAFEGLLVNEVRYLQLKDHRVRHAFRGCRCSTLELILRALRNSTESTSRCLPLLSCPCLGSGPKHSGTRTSRCFASTSLASSYSRT